jgi:hypothetical protein
MLSVRSFLRYVIGAQLVCMDENEITRAYMMRSYLFLLLIHTTLAAFNPYTLIYSCNGMVLDLT